MSLSHPLRVIISKGRRKEKTIKKFISSPKNESAKAAQNTRTRSPLRHNIISFDKIDPPHNQIIFNFTKLTNKNYKKLLNNYKEELHALERARKKYGDKGYYFEHDRVDAEGRVISKHLELKAISKEISKVFAILKRKAQNKKKLI